MRSVRSPFQSVVGPIAITLGVAWLAAFPLVTWFTRGGAADAERLGFWGWALSWLLLAALSVAGTCLGYRLLVSIAQGNKYVTERGTVRLACSDAFVAMTGGFALSFLPLTFLTDVFMGTAVTAMLGFFFTAAVLIPRYIANWQGARGDQKVTGT